MLTARTLKGYGPQYVPLLPSGKENLSSRQLNSVPMTLPITLQTLLQAPHTILILLRKLLTTCLIKTQFPLTKPALHLLFMNMKSSNLCPQVKKTSPGPDKIQYRLFKQCAMELTPTNQLNWLGVCHILDPRTIQHSIVSSIVYSIIDLSLTQGKPPLLCANFGLPRPLCFRLRPDVRDRQTDVRQTVNHRLMPPPISGGIIMALSGLNPS